jgi:hypothetical protein
MQLSRAAISGQWRAEDECEGSGSARLTSTWGVMGEEGIEPGSGEERERGLARASVSRLAMFVLFVCMHKTK